MIVIKLGGSILGSVVSPTILEDVQSKASSGLIIVHGGGDEVTEVAEKLGKQQKFIVSPEGIRSRYTDKETVEIYTMVMAGKLNKQIVATLQSRGIPAIGLSGIDASILKAKRKKKLIIVDERGRKRIVEGGFTGKIDSVNTEILKSLLEKGYTPVISPIAIGEEYEFLNVDGDRAAAYVAGALKAEKLVFLTDVQGVRLGDQFVERLPVAEAKRMLQQIGAGMDKKVIASVEALEMGVGEAVISSGLVDYPISSAIDHKVGTVIASG